MISATSERILDDVKAGKDVSPPLQNHLAAESRISRAERLQLVTAILDHITSTSTSNQHETFLEALSELRSLVPHMKTKSKSLVDTVATVERYAVNYALRHTAKPDTNLRIHFLQESLREIFEARKKSTRRPRTRPGRTRNTILRNDKENFHPHVRSDELPEDLIAKLLCTSKDEISFKDILPQTDSSVVASTVAGAITILFTASKESTSLSSLLLLAQGFLMPWIEYLRSFGEDKVSTTACAYASRISRFLLLRCQITRSNPFDVFRVRSFAIRIGEIKLNRYTRDLLQSANFLLRNKTLSPKEQKFASDLVFEAYQDAAQFLSSIDAEDPKWFYEDVSAWIDSVYLLWSKNKLFPRIPKLLQNRKSMYCKNRHDSFQSLCFSLQDDLYKTGAFCEEKALVYDGDVQVFSKSTWNKVEEVLHSNGFQNQAGYFPLQEPSSDEVEAGNVGLESLRLLRVLEPLRQTIVAVPKEKLFLPRGAENVLRIFLHTIFKGLQSTSHVTSSKEDHLLFDELESRLQKMVGGAIQAARNLLRHYWDSYDPQRFGSVYKLTHHIINQHRRFCEDSAKRWRSWVFLPILSTFEGQLATANKGNCQESAKALERVATVSEVCLSNPLELLTGTIIPIELSSLFEIAREAYACLRRWSKMAFVSLSLLSVHSTLSHVHESDQKAKDAAQTFVQDAANSILRDSTLPDLDGIDIGYDFVLATLHEFLWWTYNNQDEFKSADRLDQLRCGIQLARLFFMKRCSACNRSCGVDRLHLLWLSHACQDGNSERGEFANDISGSNRCNGHVRTGFFSVHEQESHCKPQQLSLARELLSCWNAIKAEKFPDAGKCLPKMMKLVSLHSQMMDCLELRIVAIEILEWIGIKLSLQSYGMFAKQVSELLKVCRPFNNKASLPFLETTPGNPLLQVSQLLKEDTAMTMWSYSTRYFSFDADRLNLIHETERTMQQLKSVLVGLEVGRGRKKMKAHEQMSCVIAGAVIDIGFHVPDEAGKRTLSKVLLLIHNLVRVAIVLLWMENMNDSRYYMERSLYVANQCLPSRSFLLKVINIMHQTICIPEAARRDEVERNLSSMAIDTFRSNEDGTDPRILASVISELCWSMVDTTISRFQEKAKNKPNLPLIDALKQCQNLFNEAKRSEGLSSISEVELRLLKGMAHTVIGNCDEAAPFMEPLMLRDLNLLSSLSMFATFCIVWCNLKCAKDIERTTSINSRPSRSKNSSGRVTRSRSKKAGIMCSKKTDVRQELVDKAKISLGLVEREDVWNLGLPWIQRRLMSFGGFLGDDPKSGPYRAILSIGTTFNLRREYASQVVNRISSEESMRSTTAFQQTSWRSIMSGGKQFKDVMHWLDQNKSVLVGLTIDEHKQVLLIWRMSGAGTTCKSLVLADNGPVSYDGVISRMEHVLGVVKNSAAKPGQKFSKDEKIQWWEERSRLDEEMRSILVDIETHWLGNEGAALLSPTILSEATGALCSRRSKGRSRNCKKKEIIVNESPELLVKALEELNLGDRTDSRSKGQESFAGHLILLVDTVLERIPWESLPVLRNLGVTASRVPSFSYLYACIQEPHEEINVKKLFYVINPAGDLQRTENHFRKVLTRYPTWSGFSGKAEANAVAAKYDGEEIFLYCGHGSGEQYFPPVRLCRKRKAPVALLMGCSSLRPTNLGIGDQESNGTAINFLIHGSKAVVGNLWDVTDGEIDRLTSSILREWLGADANGSIGERRLSLAEALTESRPKCMLPYLVGAACVAIGVPHVYATSIQMEM